MRHFRRTLAWVTVIPAAVLGFQNCAGYQPNSAASASDTVATCSGPACEMKPENVQLKIANYNNISLNVPTGTTPSGCSGNNSHCFDVSGYCETAGYPNHAIFTELDGTTGYAEEQMSGVQCDSNGRFRVLITLPANYDYSTHILKVTLRSYDSNGAVINNPLTSNVGSISVISQ